VKSVDNLLAAAVIECVMEVSQDAFDLATSLDGLENCTDEQRQQIGFILGYVTLFHAQEQVWEYEIPDESMARQFEADLFRWFSEIFGADPTPFVLEVANHSQQRQEGDKLLYVGLKVCKLIDQRSAVLLMQIVHGYYQFLMSCGFYTRLHQVFEMSETHLKQIRNRVIAKYLHGEARQW
jgi:hypothetical protein